MLNANTDSKIQQCSKRDPNTITDGDRNTNKKQIQNQFHDALLWNLLHLDGQLIVHGMIYVIMYLVEQFKVERIQIQMTDEIQIKFRGNTDTNIVD